MNEYRIESDEFRYKCFLRKVTLTEAAKLDVSFLYK